MRKLLNSRWAVSLLVVIAIAMVGDAILDGRGGPKRRTGRSSGGAGNMSEAGLAAASAPLSPREILASIVLPDPLPDPFGMRKPPVETAVTGAVSPELRETVHLSAIWVQGSATLVLLNDRICAAGDSLGAVRLESADLDGVWLSHAGGRDFLSLGGVLDLLLPTGRSSPSATVALHED